MNIESLKIREMRSGEEKTVMKLGRKSFPFFEGLFVGKPKKAMLAELEGCIVGAIMYKKIDSTTAYIDEAFVAPEHHGIGVGKKLYSTTFNFLRDNGCSSITALVKDDNVASFKLFTDNGFKRIGLEPAVTQLGAKCFVKHCLSTPMLFATGMDFYMASDKVDLKGKCNPLSQILVFFLANFLFLFPLWIRLFSANNSAPLHLLSSYLLILILFLLPRLLFSLWHREGFQFRFNNCGCLVTILLSIFGNPFPMNANLYPKEYKNTTAFKKTLFIPEIIKWVIFSILPLLPFALGDYFNFIAQISCYYLLYMVIPFYPFEALGGGRIFRYSKPIWLITLLITLIELTLVFSLSK